MMAVYPKEQGFNKVKESVLIMLFVFALSALSYFLTQSEKERAIASGKGSLSPIQKVPAGYQK
jgi:hypothetical protein